MEPIAITELSFIPREFSTIKHQKPIYQQFLLDLRAAEEAELYK